MYLLLPQNEPALHKKTHWVAGVAFFSAVHPSPRAFVIDNRCVLQTFTLVHPQWIEFPKVCIVCILGCFAQCVLVAPHI